MVADTRATPDDAAQTEPQPPVAQVPQATVIPGADSLIGDLLDMDLGGPPMQQQGPPYGQPPPVQGSVAMDLLGEGLDSLVSDNYKLQSFTTPFIY